jgi:hypothetical protein
MTWKRWLKMPTKYELIQHDNQFHDNHWCVKIVEGDYSGVVYQYDTISFKEAPPPSDGEFEMVLSFNTLITENPNNLDLADKSFETVAGDILVNIIEERMSELDENRTNNPEKSDK